MTPAHQIFVRLAAKRREQALLDAILVRLCDRGRILPGEELYREPGEAAGG